MRKFGLFILMLLFALSVTAQNDSVLVITEDMDKLTEAQIYSNPLYIFAHPSKRHLTKSLIRASACDCNPTIPNRRIGVFSVSGDKKVSFSQGNLQYLPAANIWKFANTQYEYLGNANKYLKPTFRNWVDLFGWSADNTTAPFGVSTSTNVADYQGDFVDWGTNTICGDAPGTWRTMSKEEWEYLIKKRKKAATLHGVAAVNGIAGLVLLPDDWVCPNGIVFKSGFHENYGVDYFAQYQSFTVEQWQRMEEAGAVFLPTAGWCEGATINSIQRGGHYWSATQVNTDEAHYLTFSSKEFVNNSNTRYRSLAVRLVHDTVVPSNMVTLSIHPTPEDAKVSFHCSGYQWAGNSITVDKGKDVLYQVTNVDAGYLSQGDSIYNLTKDSVLYVTLRPFSDGNWVVVDNSEYTKQEGYYVSRNNGGFASHSVWNYYVLPVLPGETYRVRGIAGQHAALWMAASTAPDPATNTRPTKISCCANRGVAAYVADEVTIPDGAKYLIINSRNNKEMMVERKVPDPCMVVKVNDTLSINLMCVEGGTFTMGAMEGDEIAKDDEKPAHKVTLTYDYHIMQTEVTQGLWEAVMGEDIYVAQTNMENAPKPAYVGADYPMYYVRMNDALEFIDKLNAMTGMHFRLPTEAEWEYAARGGNKSKGYLYAGSDDPNEVGWYYGRGMHHVAKLKPNELGIYDMSGNVGEMCLDYGTYGETYKAGDVVNPRGNIRANGNRFWRGGSYTHSKDSMRVSQRSSYTPSWGGTWLGLRLVLAEDNDFRTIRVSNSYFDMSFVKGGTFMMGSDDGDSDEKPVHEVTLSDYYIMQTEVTQHLWKKVMGTTIREHDETYKANYRPAGVGDDYPMYLTNKADCQAFVDKLNALTGLRFRLPTEAEWEYAARGGQKSRGYIYPGSNNIDEVAWYKNTSNDETHPVALKKPNELGIYDMAGNVWEWVSDWYGKYPSEAQTDPTGPATGTSAIARGGSRAKIYSAYNCRNTERLSFPQGARTFIGMRLVLEETALTPPEPEYVDLGLSVKWATFNVGATSPEDYGDYFAWGETEPKEEYSWATYKWCDGTSSNMTKYCSDSLYDNADYKTTLDPEDDAAIVGLGGNWRMPAKEEWMELKQKCTWERITINGITGYQVTGKNGNSIFLPRAGLRIMKKPHAADSVGYYASSSHISKYKKENFFYYMLMCDSIITISSGMRYYGYPIRPVYDDRPEPCLIVKVNDTLSINMMCVEGGTMYIGRGDTVNRPYRQRPLRQVTISDFYLGQTEVTQELWLAIMGENPTYFPCDTCLCHPVDSVSIDEVLLFIERLNSLTGYNFRLPTEAEWEYAARGGVRSKGYAYAGSDNVNEVAWYGVGDSRGGTPHPVAQKRPNELGLYDMHGNLWEFVHDKFVDDINIYPSVNPTGPEGMRGSATGCGSAYYSALMPENTWGWVGTGGGRSRWFGFRLALSDQDPFVPITIGKYRFHMMYVQGGTFMMGSDAPDAEPNEKPVHEVTLSDYYIGQTEVTQKLWKLVMGNNNNPSANKGDELPVTNITWDEAQVFVQKLSEMTGLHFRLPTEAEWEYAARGGQNSKGYTYAGADASEVDKVGWVKENTNKLHNIGLKQPNELGIYDMTGNAWEWVSDWYSKYPSEAQTDPTGPDSGTSRILRGGSFHSEAVRSTVTYRQVRQGDAPDSHISLRLVMEEKSIVDD